MATRYERRYHDVVEAKQIPPDPRLSDLLDLMCFCELRYMVSPGQKDGIPSIRWFRSGKYNDADTTEPGWWVTKDENGCISFIPDEEFSSQFTKIEETDHVWAVPTTDFSDFDPDPARREQSVYLG